MTDKVKVPRDVYKVLQHFEGKWNKDEFFNFHVIEIFSRDNPDFKTLVGYILKVGCAEYAKAIINGYEVEETVEELLKRNDKSLKDKLQLRNGYRLAIYHLSEYYPELKGVLDGE